MYRATFNQHGVEQTRRLPLTGFSPKIGLAHFGSSIATVAPTAAPARVCNNLAMSWIYNWSQCPDEGWGARPECWEWRPDCTPPKAKAPPPKLPPPTPRTLPTPANAEPPLSIAEPSSPPKANAPPPEGKASPQQTKAPPPQLLPPPKGKATPQRVVIREAALALWYTREDMKANKKRLADWSDL